MRLYCHVTVRQLTHRASPMQPTSTAGRMVFTKCPSESTKRARKSCSASCLPISSLPERDYAWPSAVGVNVINEFV